MLRRLAAIPLLIAIMLGTGCAVSPIRAWQSSVEQYVQEQGNGDVNVLRAIDGEPDESPFGMIAAGRGGFPFIAPRRTDANGVLLGHRFMHERGWYFFLVGLVEYRGKWVDWPLDDPTVTDIRLVALSLEDGEFRWMVSDRDRDSVADYLQPQLDDWRASHPDRTDARTAPTTFPTPGDRFSLFRNTPLLTVVDDRSRAAWVLPMPVVEEPQLVWR